MHNGRPEDEARTEARRVGFKAGGPPSSRQTKPKFGVSHVPARHRQSAILQSVGGELVNRHGQSQGLLIVELESPPIEEACRCSFFAIRYPADRSTIRPLFVASEMASITRRFCNPSRPLTSGTSSPRITADGAEHAGPHYFHDLAQNGAVRTMVADHQFSTPARPAALTRPSFHRACARWVSRQGR